MSRDERVSCCFIFRVNFKMVLFWLFYICFIYLSAVNVEGSYLQKQARSARSDWGFGPHNGIKSYWFFISVSYILIYIWRMQVAILRIRDSPSKKWRGPSTWGGICRTGKKQSPIDFQMETVILKDYPPFVFNEDYLSKQKFQATNNGHTVLVTLEDESVQPVIYGGGLKDKFIFKQLHFHWESEHTFEGKRADLEMHMVHYNSKYKSYEEANTKADGIAVLGVFFNERNETDHLIENFFDYILNLAHSEENQLYTSQSSNFLPGGEEEIKPTTFALRDLLPKYTSRFLRYEGSFTTPDCSEIVIWTVFINRLPVPRKTLMDFRTLKDPEGNILLKNFRPPQKLNGREVYMQMKNYDNQPKFECESLTGGGSYSNPILAPYVPYCFLYLLPKIH